MPLIRLSPEQVMRFWDEIAQCIESALPMHLQGDPYAIVRIQKKLLTEGLQCWIAAGDHLGNKIYGVATTNVVADDIAGIKNLLIYTVTVVDDHPPGMWEEARRILSIYARSLGCQGMIAYSDNPIMFHVCEKLGANTNTRLIYFGL